MKDLVSIIIRTRNEERWISQVLRAVFNQSYKNFEVIIVDNESIDKTIEKAKQFKISRILRCKDYLPGKALNMGIRAAGGNYIVCLSGHCIPVNQEWLANLLKGLSDKEVAGVYGRQEPLDFTSDADKRDLSLIFGLDQKVQLKDSFFHNANSIIRKEVWKAVSFDQEVTNIEDRVWAKRVLQLGFKIIYEPTASVYHYHGINQDGNPKRCTNVVRILEKINSGYKYKSIEIDQLNTIAIIPVRGTVQNLKGRPLLAYTIERALQSKYIKRTIVSTDNQRVAKLARQLGAEAPFLREPALSGAYVDLNQVFQYSLKRIEELKIFPDLLVTLEVTFPFRPKGLLDDMIVRLASAGLDSIVAARSENRAVWKERTGEIQMLDEGQTPRQFKEPAFIELRGVGCVTHPEFIREGKLLGGRIGLYDLSNPYSHLEVRSEEDFKLASLLTRAWFK